VNDLSTAPASKCEIELLTEVVPKLLCNSKAGRTLAEVRDAAGHSDVTITSGYLHVAVEGSEVGALFE
jgi:hypothetical protein